jgi:hypothetical protein
MKSIFIILLSLVVVISGCSFVKTVPVKRNFPEPIPELMKKCEDLKTIPPGDRVAITDMLRTVIENYQLYHICSIRVDGWQEWYEEQKKIFDGVK